MRHGRVASVVSAARVLKGERRRVHPDALRVPLVALVATPAPRRLSRRVGQAERAHVGAVHVVEEGDGADAQANAGARGTVVGEPEEVAR
jgi:hypothetical protein